MKEDAGWHGDSTIAQTTLSSPVTLGFCDAAVAPDEEIDIFSQRIGGRPSWPGRKGKTARPPSEIAQCLSCQEVMPLLFQAYVPLEEGERAERHVFLWVCLRARCRRKAGHVRAWRVVLSQKRQDERKVSGVPLASAATATDNPFSSGARPHHGLGQMLFAANGQDPSTTAPFRPFETELSSDSSDLSDSLEKLQLTSLIDESPKSDWVTTAPVLEPSWYLYTSSEDLLKSSAPTSGKAARLASGYIDEFELEPSSKSASSGNHRGASSPLAQEGSWSDERYEKPQLRGMDQAFRRFTKRVAPYPDQCVRYDLSGEPLPFTHQDDFGKRVFPISEADRHGVRLVRIGGAAMTSSEESKKARYDASRVERCKQCGAYSTFEYQIMPAVIPLLHGSAPALETITEEERMARIKAILEQQEDRLDFGTIMVLTCSKHCSSESATVKTGDYAWLEEVAHVQYEP